MIASSTDTYRFSSFFGHRNMTAGLALLETARKSRTTKIAKKKLPFLFFGAAPGDWYEGANNGHLYIVCFEGILDPAKRKKLAVLGGNTWRFAVLDGRTWACFLIGGDPFEKMRAALTALHKTIRLREVIFAGLREESERDEWTIWSHAQNTAAKRVPLFPGIAGDRIFYFADREVVPVEDTRDSGLG